MKKTIIALFSLTGILQASTVVTLGGYQTSEESPYDASFATDTLTLVGGTGATGNINLNFTLNNGDTLASTTSPGGRIFSNYATSGSWNNSAALEEMNRTLGVDISLGQINALNSTYTGWAASQTSITLTLNSYEVGDNIAFYALVTNQNAPLTHLSISGLENATYSYATDIGNGYVGNATFSDSAKDWTLVKVVGTLTERKTITLSSNTGNYKHGYGMVAYTLVPEPATATLSLLALTGLAARRRRK